MKNVIDENSKIIKCIFYGFLGTLILVIVVFFLTGSIIKSVKKLTSALESVSDGNLDTKVEIRDHDEIGRLAEEIKRREQAEAEKEELEFEIREQQKMESIGFPAGGVAREIINTFNGIMNYGQLILDNMDSDSEEAEYSREIISETERISKIIRTLNTKRQDKGNGYGSCHQPFHNS